MVADLVSSFKTCVIDNLNSQKINVDTTALKIIHHHRGDAVIHCGKSKWDGLSTEDLKNQNQVLKIDEILFEQNQLFIKLNRSSTYTECFKNIFAPESLFPINNGLDQERKIISLIYDTECSFDDLTNFRIDLLVQTTRTLATAAGYDVRTNKIGLNGLYFTYKSNQPKDSTGDHKIVLCGPVLNATASGKERKMNVTNYKRLKKAILIHEMENRDNFDEELSEVLVNAVLKFEFLRVKACSPIMLQFSDSETSSSGSAIFVLYNYSRLNAIIHEFENRVLKKYYPPLPSVELIDFSVLKEEKEWILAFKYVMNFPLIVKETVQHLQEGKPSPHLLCSFLFSFARTISSYYRSTKILLEAKPNLIPVVNARIYLIKAIQRILLTALELLDIKAVPVL